LEISQLKNSKLFCNIREKPESGQAGLFRETDFEISRTLPPVHPLLEWNYVARSPLCDTVDKIGESEVDVVRVRAKSTNCRSRMHV